MMPHCFPGRSAALSAGCLFAFVILVSEGGLQFVTPAAAAQSPAYVSLTPEAAITLAQKLKQDLQDGSVRMADLHAIELRLALAGALKDDLSAKVNAVEQLPNPDKPEPKLTAGLVPAAEKLIADLNEPNLRLARNDVERLAAQIHVQHELYRRQQIQSAAPGDAEIANYLDLSDRLQQSLRAGDIAGAAVLAVDVQSAEDKITAEKKQPIDRSKNIYNINDALGRAAFLTKDYLSAGDYLLKAADTPGKDPVLRTFGPDLWLARALSSAGYKDVVVTFLERCKVFWPGPHLDEWISTLQNGGSPDFSHNIWSAGPAPSH
jgi:hypothetical protein